LGISEIISNQQNTFHHHFLSSNGVCEWSMVISRPASSLVLGWLPTGRKVVVVVCSAVLPISFFITRFDMFNTYFIVQYQEGSKLPIYIDTVHLKLYCQLLNQFWEL
jgi:hypothetical protein